MSYRVHPAPDIAPGLHRALLDQLEKALDELDDPDLSDVDAMHQARRRCKKMRAAFRLVRPAMRDSYRTANAHFRDVARRAASLRESEAALECYDRVMGAMDEETDHRPFGPIRRVLTLRRNSLVEEDAPAARRELRERLEEGRELISLDLDPEGWAAVADGLRKTYRRARNRLHDSLDHPDPERLHEWRKRVKYHRYHCRLLRPLWVAQMDFRRDQLHHLSDLLGELHDMHELRALVLARTADFGGADVDGFLHAMDEQARSHRRRSLKLGRLLFSEKPKALVRRFGDYWTTTLAAERPLSATDGTNARD